MAAPPPRDPPPWETSAEEQLRRYGATISSVKAPDRRGSLGECVLGFDEETSYAATWPRGDATCPYFGCAVGRVANRVANAAFSLDGKDYKVKANNGAHHLHGGGVGFDKKRWAVVEATDTALTLALRSPDGEEGYPGCVDARITYSLPTPTSLKIEYAATTDAATPLNLTNHSHARAVPTVNLEIRQDFAEMSRNTPALSSTQRKSPRRLVTTQATGTWRTAARPTSWVTSSG